ncbi:AAA family ATPase [Flavobacteriaceae bacterium 14752]|uniref:AAA family ATPase n=1 Tax=Mesohalobacter salilacus TaxID=2491711 RepID=UPI000F640FAF|nr:nicotinate-nucleotide adenylyltransferase [Flavobacteriaceae bacterium 14752]
MEKTAQQTQSQLIKVVFYGPESTGKTTLAKTLAEQYHTQWVPEFARDYLQDKYNKTGKACEASDIMPIAEGQKALENQRAKISQQYLFCDTNLLETYVYARVYFPDKDFSRLKSMALSHDYDYYFLTDIDTPWEADDLRDKPNERQEMFEVFKNYLTKYEKKFYILRGNLNERISKVNTILQTNNYATSSKR